MRSTDPLDPSLPHLSLEPLAIAGSPGAPALAGVRAIFHPNTRARGERRQTADRRTELRFQSDRRSGNDRRPKNSWEPGSNL